MSKPSKKQRHKGKREAKKREMRRRESISPIKRLADASGEIECWMSDGFGEFGQMQIFAYKRGAGLSGVACFLIDRGVVGLKDAWTKLRVDRAEFDFMIECSQSHGIGMKPVRLMEARHWVASGARWAHDNGMRLPKDWAKVASIIGGVGDWVKADVSEFEMEFAGRPDDLRQRLVGQPFDEFIRRTDIRFIFNDNAPMMDIQTGEYEDEHEDFEEESILDAIPEEELRSMLHGLTSHASALGALTSDWLAARNEKPAAELLEAWRTVMLATSMAAAAVPDKNPEVVHIVEHLINELRDRIDGDRIAAFDWAVDKVIDHLAEDPSLIGRALNEKLGEDLPVDRLIDVDVVENKPLQENLS